MGIVQVTGPLEFSDFPFRNVIIEKIPPAILKPGRALRKDGGMSDYVFLLASLLL